MTLRSPEKVAPFRPKPDSDGQEQVRAQIERVLNSPLFRSSQRCQSLFRHVTERALAGETTSLKERILGVEVFGRLLDYDTNADPVVRGTAGEIRKKLAQYYQNPEHAGEPRIELHPGSYIPEFLPANGTAPSPATHPKRRRVLLAGAGVAILVASAVFLFARGVRSDVDRFWRPMLDAPGGVLFCIAQPRVYNFRSDARQRQVETAIEGLPPGALESSRELIPLGQLVPMWDRYLAFGDATCLLRLTSLFEKRGKSYSIRSQAATTFSDLRERPSVLIGAFDNDWTLRATGNLRYTFYKDFKGLELVRDRDHPEKTEWKLVNSWPSWNIPYDYAIVSRVLDRGTDRMVVVAAGITHFGTAGAGEFLSDPRYLAEAIPQLPRDWPKRNLQIVLRIPVVQGVSGHPQVLATYAW